MALRARTEGQPTRERPVGLLAQFLAELQVIINRVPERLTDLIDRRAFERDHIGDVNDSAVKNASLLVYLDLAGIAFIRHHGMTPAFFRKSRISSTVLSLASLLSF